MVGLLIILVVIIIGLLTNFLIMRRNKRRTLGNTINDGKYGVFTISVNINTSVVNFEKVQVRGEKLESYGDQVIMRPIDILSPIDNYQKRNALVRLDDKQMVRREDITWVNDDKGDIYYEPELELNLSDMMCLLRGGTLLKKGKFGVKGEVKILTKSDVTQINLLDEIIKS